MDKKLEKLDDKNIELCKVLYDLKESLDLDKIIGLNASTLDLSGAAKHFFAYSQYLAQRYCAISICKIFEEPKKYELNSIPGILDFIEKENIPFDSKEKTLEEFITKYGKKEPSSFVAVKKVFEEFVEHHKNDIEEIKDFRDKQIAHSETTELKNKSIPSYDVMEKFLQFGIDFYSMISKGYLNNGPVDFTRDAKVFGSVCNLLKKIGIENVQRDFTD